MIKIVVYNVEEKIKVIYNLGVLIEKKICISKKNIGLLCNQDEILSIDRILWTFSSNYFIPHDIAKKNDDCNRYEDKNENQPLLLTTDLNDIIDRDIICVLTEESLFNVLNSMIDTGISKDIEVIYIAYNINIENFKNSLKDIQIKESNELLVDLYVQQNGKWQQDK